MVREVQSVSRPTELLNVHINRPISIAERGKAYNKSTPSPQIGDLLVVGLLVQIVKPDLSVAGQHRVDKTGFGCPLTLLHFEKRPYMQASRAQSATRLILVKLCPL